MGFFIDRQSAVNIIGNEITTVYGDAIQLDECHDNIKIANNKIVGTYTSSQSGIYLNNSDGQTTESFRGTIANNVIIINASDGNNDDTNYGIELLGSDYHNIYHNTVFVNTSSELGAGLYANTGSNIRVKNNNIYINYGYAYKSSNGTNISESNYNNYYTTGNFLASWNSGNIYDLAALRTANSKDANSVSVFPSFKSMEDPIDLHPTTNWLNNIAVDLMASDLTGLIDYDLDSIARATTPDFGAYEFAPNNTFTYSGTVSINKGGSGTFLSFTEAIDSLKKLGVSGPLTVNVDDGIYTERISMPEIPGVNSTNRITFKSTSNDSTKATLQFSSTSSSDNYLVFLNNTDYITFEKMTFKNTGATYARIFRLNGNAHDIKINNSILIGNGIGADSDLRSLISCLDDNLNNLTITNNSFSNGDRGISLFGVGTTDKGTGIIISDNKFSGNRSNIYIDDNTDFLISNNLCENFDWAGIHVSYCSSPYTIRNNRVFSANSTDYGISIDYCDGSGNGGLIYNNFVYLEHNPDAVWGIRLRNSSYQSIYNNSVNIVSSYSNASYASSSAALYYDRTAGTPTNINIKNNNLVVNGPGYPMVIENASTVISESDFNNLYTGGSFIAYWNTANYSDLASLTAASGNDANSVNYNPGYLSNTDLHSNSYWLDNAGTPIASIITDDIDGESRDVVNPDIGADEYTSTLVPYDGEYTIGTSGRFASFKIAIDSITERGVLDTVIFKVLNGNYNEQMVLPQIPNVSENAVIIFEANSGNADDVVVTFDPSSTNNYIVKFEGSDYITFRNITFQSGNTADSRIFVFEGKCESINISNNKILGRSELTSTENDAVFYAKENSPILHKISINNNIISNGSYGIFFENNSSESGTEMFISENIFNCYFQGAYLKYFVAPKIENNLIEFSAADGTGINIQYCSSAASYGFNVANNQIYADNYANLKGAIYIAYSDATASFPGKIVNNAVRVGIDNSTRSIGIFLTNSDNINIYHNTVNITSNQIISVSGSKDLVFYSTASNNLNIVNNNFVIKGNVENRSFAYGYAIYIADGTIGTCDYNNLYSPGKFLAYWQGTACGTLNDWKTTSGKGAHSVSYFPAFRGKNNLKMKSTWLDNKGTPLTSVTSDIDSIARNVSNPDIGAYEYDHSVEPITTGTYNVGVGQTYPSLDSLVNTLLERGISGSVTFNLVAGTYSNTNIILKDIPGTNANDTVVIQSFSGSNENTIISGIQSINANYLFALNGADYLSFKDLTFNSGGTTYARVLNIDGNAQNIKIINCVLNGQTIASDDQNRALIYVPNEQIVDYLLIKNSKFVNNSYGIYFGGYTSYNHNSLELINNEFTGQFRQINFNYTKKPYIYGNTISNGTDRGIYLNYTDDDFKILKNTIFSSDPNFYGIHINYCDGTSANKGLIANNFIGVNGGTESYGIRIENSNYQRTYYNSVKITGASGASIYTAGGGNLEMANNIFVSTGTNTYSYRINTPAAIVYSNYNDFYSTGTKFIYYGGVSYSTIETYQAASSLDNNSLDFNPVFTSETDFHLLSDSVVGKAIPLVDVITDYDNETRDVSTPDIGADEFSCLFFPTPTITDVTACSNEDIPSLNAEGTNIKWYSDRGLTTEIWSANEYDPGISTPGVYTFYVTQTLGECTSTVDSATLTILAAPQLLADIIHIDCQGTNYGTINLTVTGNAPYNYLWSNDKQTEDISGLIAGDYIVNVTDVKGCSEIDTFTVTSPSEIILDIITEDTECDTSFGKATVVATGGEAPYNYSWSNGEGTTVIDSLFAGIYIVTVTDNRGCSKFCVAAISDIGAPSINPDNISVTDVSCYGGSNGAISLSVSGGSTPYTYLWSNGATTEDISTLKSGSYELTVSGNDGCQSIVSVEVDQPDPIKILLNITETSCGQSNGAAQAIVSGGTPSYTYDWSNGSTSSTISGLDLGAYDIEVTDNKGCKALKYFSISEIGAPSVIIDSIFEGTCGNSNGAIYISVYGAYSTYNYLWSNTATTQDLIGVDPDTYNVTVSDSSGCSAVQVATIESDKPEPNPICMVTVNTDTHYNEIVWEKNYTENVHHYNIYKEGTQSGVYTVIGTTAVNEESIFVDLNSDVSQRAWRYKISVVDSCGVESDLSNYHKTMHLTMNQGLGGSINLIWDHYEGFDFSTYYIYRKSNAGWALIDSVPDNLTSYTDHNPILDENLYYLIEIKHPYGCNPTKAGRNTSRSNISTPAHQTAPDVEAPTAPTSLSTTQITDTTISLIWRKSTDNVGVTGYLIFKNSVELNEVTDTVYTVTGLTKLTSYSFFVKAKDAAKNVSEASNTINPTTTGSTGIENIGLESKIKLYPNPTNGLMTIAIESDKDYIYSYFVRTVSGQIVKSEVLGNIRGKGHKLINLSQLPNGLYLITIEFNGLLYNDKIIINK